MGMFDDIPLERGRASEPQPAEPVRRKRNWSDSVEDLELSFMDRMLAKARLPKWLDDLAGDRGAILHRVARGAMVDPVVGVVQTAANLLPDATGIPQAVNRRIAEEEGQYESARSSRGGEGFDGARFVGNVLSPTNAVIAAKVPFAAATGARILQGAAIGGGTAAMQPIADADERGFWGQKTAQAATGATLGAVLTPALAAIGERAIRRLVDRRGVAAAGAADTDSAIAAALREAGQAVGDVPPPQLEALRAQVSAALREGMQIDPAAALRKADFDALGMQGTAGQVTRDPRQFAREQRLAPVEGVGEPLSGRFQDQGKTLQEWFSGWAGGAKDPYVAGAQLGESLKRTDDVLNRHVGGLYREARESAGRDLDIPLQGLAQDYARVLDDFGDKVPGVIRSKFAALGMDPALPSNQRAVFTMKDADHLQKVINAHVGNDPATNRALAQLRGALRSAVETVDASGGPYAPAVRAARERFQMHEAVPALRAAAEGSIAPEDFVRRFITGGKVDEVTELGKVLKQADPAAFQEARAQIGATLRRAAYGENAAGDAPFRSARYMEEVRRLGPHKLRAFFEPKEVEEIMRVGRVGAYIKQAPNAAFVNTSNTASAAANLLSKWPGMSTAASVGARAVRSVRDQRDIDNALRAEVPRRKAPLSPRQRNRLRELMLLGSVGSGVGSGRSWDE